MSRIRFPPKAKPPSPLKKKHQTPISSFVACGGYMQIYEKQMSDFETNKNL